MDAEASFSASLRLLRAGAQIDELRQIATEHDLIAKTLLSANDNALAGQGLARPFRGLGDRLHDVDARELPASFVEPPALLIFARPQQPQRRRKACFRIHRSNLERSTVHLNRRWLKTLVPG